MSNETYNTVEEDNAYETEARSIGYNHGRTAASWVFDGNTSDETYRAYLAAVGNTTESELYREPNLSGEFADDWTDRDLADELGIDPESDEMDDLANAYLEAASFAFHAELERVARYHTEGDK